MGRLTIHTVRYGAAVAELLGENELWRAQDGTTFSAGAAWRGEAFVQGLFALLFDVAVAENPIYSHSPRLTSCAAKLKDSDEYRADYREFRAFLRTSRTLNIEGYVRFRMEKIRYRLDTLIFSVLRQKI